MTEPERLFVAARGWRYSSIFAAADPEVVPGAAAPSARPDFGCVEVASQRPKTHMNRLSMSESMQGVTPPEKGSFSQVFRERFRPIYRIPIPYLTIFDKYYIDIR